MNSRRFIASQSSEKAPYLPVYSNGVTSASGQNQTLPVGAMSALLPKADIEGVFRYVRLLPEADILGCNQKTLLDHFVGGGEQRR